MFGNSLQIKTILLSVVRVAIHIEAAFSVTSSSLFPHDFYVNLHEGNLEQM